ncbi:hypothetical protein SLINC_6578 [Streptomyces lincolnensis]|uniref:Uncharacterized protein n=1 Tax=Streptomyces lincolnensis TaxID=1915 RepID=A0A1B1MK82_STRLN|nr:hypothetical protein [Streptomyces lincolnensis]ANS68802.1 hypothetical protein SLINC_6578 [Streptomyces lincolnensis]AXG52992.1 hypothetical protein SLCG_1837 [Streptomyces lincolnensis]QMV10404.1 hypothetical protein GJU35_35255 [Streptomyces lincolnensis]
MRGVRRAASLVVPALFALVSCGIPETGVVEAGGPASGVVPTVRVFFVADGALVSVPRRTPAPIEVESALEILLQGPTDAERAKGLTTRLPLPMLVPSALVTPPATSPPGVPGEAAPASDVVAVTTRGGVLSVEVSIRARELAGPAADQLICTALAAQHVAEPGAEPKPVTVTGADGRGVRGSGADCPG